jgi:hypothetical protein
VIGHTRGHAGDSSVGRGHHSQVGSLNIVCLVGRLAAPFKDDIPLRPGWTSLLLRVPRQGPRGEEDAGVFTVQLALPPRLATSEGRDIGAQVSVVGMLATETDYSTGIPHVHHAVIPHSIERLPAPY